MPRVLLVLPSATYRAPDFMAAARRLGADVVVASDRRQAMSSTIGERALVVDLRRPEVAADAVAALHERLPLDAVVAVDEQGVEVAARAAWRLGLRGNPPEAARAARDKAAMRAALARAGVCQPAFLVAGPGEDAGAIGARVGFPCVVKPVGLSGSRGVIRADDAAGARAAAARARAVAAQARSCGDLVVERFAPGPEIALEGLLRGGELDVLAIFDKPDPLEGPYFEETIYVTPSRLAPGDLRSAGREAARACTALGLREGPVHAELRLTGEGPVVIEVAARSIGGLCSRTLRFGLGASLEELVLRHALSLPARDAARQKGASGVMMIPVPAGGVLRRVGGGEEALAVPGIVGLELTVREGRPVRPVPEGDRYLGFLFARGASPEEVEAALREAHSRLEVDVEADSPGPGHEIPAALAPA